MTHIFYYTRFQECFENGFYRKFLTILTLYISLHTNFSFAGEQIFLSPGRQQTLSISDLLRGTVADSNVAAIEVNPEEQEAIVTGLSMGKTTLTIWLTNGKKNVSIVNVTEKEIDTSSELKQQLSSIEGVIVKNSGSGTTVEGQLYRSEDLEQLQKILKQYPKVQNHTKVNTSALDYFQTNMLKRLNEEGFDQIKISKAADTLYLEGFVNSQIDKNRAEKISKSLYTNTKNHLELGIENKNLILVDIKFMEVLKNSLNNLGIQWPQQIEVSTNSGLNGKSFSTILSNQSTVVLNALIEKGDAKVLSNPKLLCQSGFPASFDSGGEIPIRISSERTANVFFKSYGLHLDINAKSDSGKRTSIEVQSRISDLDMATAVDGIPGFLEHKVNTSVNLEFGRTVALAGLIESKHSKNTTKVPFLGHLPILGELFKSRNFRNNHSEFVVFLTPILANGKDSYHMQQKNLMDQAWNQKDQNLKFKLTD